MIGLDEGWRHLLGFCMRSKYLILLTFFLFWIVWMVGLSPVWAEEPNAGTFTTGKDWRQRMSLKEKFISIFAPSLLFHRYGVPLRRPINDYIQTIDKVLMENPYLEKEDVSNIFASTIYAYEPESRPALDSLERALKERKTYEEEFATSLLPHLVVRTTPKKEYESSLLT